MSFHGVIALQKENAIGCFHGQIPYMPINNQDMVQLIPFFLHNHYQYIPQLN